MKGMKIKIPKNKKPAALIVLMLSIVIVGLVLFRLASINSTNKNVEEPHQSNPVLTDNEVAEGQKEIEQEGYLAGIVVSINKTAKQIIVAEKIYDNTEAGDPSEGSYHFSDKPVSFSYKTEPVVLKGISAEKVGFDALTNGINITITYNSADKTIKEIWLP
jgi:hypothetical protein